MGGSCFEIFHVASDLAACWALFSEQFPPPSMRYAPTSPQWISQNWRVWLRITFTQDQRSDVVAAWHAAAYLHVEILCSAWSRERRTATFQPDHGDDATSVLRTERFVCTLFQHHAPAMLKEMGAELEVATRNCPRENLAACAYIWAPR